MRLRCFLLEKIGREKSEVTLPLKNLDELGEAAITFSLDVWCLELRRPQSLRTYPPANLKYSAFANTSGIATQV